MPPDAEPTAAPPAPKQSKKTILIAVVIVLGVALGGGAGAFLAGPLLAGGAPKAVARPAAAGEHAADEPEADGGEQAGAVMHLVENLVLNPANSGGSRFLLLSVGFAVKDEAGATMLRERDPELRDAIIRYFGAQTVDELVDITQRDSLKAGLRGAVAERFAAAAVRDVYFPQFVVQ